MNQQGFFRPFELLKLIRDRKVSSLKEFIDYAYRHGDSRLPRILWGWQRNLQELGLIEVNEQGKISSTEGLSRFFNTLDISLTRLANYNENSIVCTPIFGRPSRPSVKSDIFVIMPFGEDLKPVYDDHIRNTVQKMKLTVARADNFFTAKAVISDIWDAINDCRLMIADCTGKNPNVFYELGMAHALGKPVILISQNKEDVPFDIQHIRYLIYEFTPRGMSEFEEKLTSTIENVLKEEFSYEMLLAKGKAGK